MSFRLSIFNRINKCSKSCKVSEQGVYKGALDYFYKLNKLCYIECPEGTDIIVDSSNNIYQCQLY